MLEGKAAVIQGDMNKLEKLDDTGMKYKKAKSCSCEIITSYNSTSCGLVGWQSA